MKPKQIVTFLFTNQSSIQFFIGMFGIYSVYIIHGLLYEKIVMSAYGNTGQKVFFQSSGGFVFIKTLTIWVLVESWAYLKRKLNSKSFKLNNININQQQKIELPKRTVWLCAFLSFLSTIMYNQAIYQTSFRFSFFLRSTSFIGLPLFALLVNKCYQIKNKLNIKTLLIDLAIGACVIYGGLMFWLDDPQVCFYIPIFPGVTSAVMVLFSSFIQAVMPGVQNILKQQYKPSLTLLWLSITRCVFALSLVWVVSTNQLFYTLDFLIDHSQFAFDMIMISILSFIGQMFVHRTIYSTNILNATPFITSSRKILTFLISYMFTIHKLTSLQKQMVWLLILAIITQTYFIIKRDVEVRQTNKIEGNAKYKHFMDRGEIEGLTSQQIQ